MAWTVIAHLPSCRNGDCPTIYRDADTGKVGIKGAQTPGAEQEHISWMTEAEFRVLAEQILA